MNLEVVECEPELIIKRNDATTLSEIRAEVRDESKKVWERSAGLIQFLREDLAKDADS